MNIFIFKKKNAKKGIGLGRNTIRLCLKDTQVDTIC